MKRLIITFISFAVGITIGRLYRLWKKVKTRVNNNSDLDENPHGTWLMRFVEADGTEHFFGAFTGCESEAWDNCRMGAAKLTMERRHEIVGEIQISLVPPVMN
jgi:hypothetical protein